MCVYMLVPSEARASDPLRAGAIGNCELSGLSPGTVLGSLQEQNTSLQPWLPPFRLVWDRISCVCLGSWPLSS